MPTLFLVVVVFFFCCFFFFFFFFLFCFVFFTVNIPRFLELAEKRIQTLSGLKHTSPELHSALNCATVCDGKYQVLFGTEMVSSSQQIPIYFLEYGHTPGPRCSKLF